MKAGIFAWVTKKRKKIISVIKNYKYKREKYSTKFAFYTLMSKRFNYKKGNNSLNLFVERKKADSINEYLSKFQKSVIDHYKHADVPTGNNSNGVIWVFWWQGESSAPPIVKRCLASIRKNSNGHQVIMIDKNNFSDYVDIPGYVIDKVYRNEITKTHFSDFLRVSLLANHGGAWIDATIYLSHPISEEVFSYPFYSMKKPIPNVGKLYFAQWSTFFIAGTKDNLLFKFLQDCYLLHWESNSEQIHYFMFDHLFWVAYKHVDAFKIMIDEVPYNNARVLKLQHKLEKPYNEIEYQEIIKENHMHKLTWKKEFRLTDQNNHPTFFGYFINTES